MDVLGIGKAVRGYIVINRSASSKKTEIRPLTTGGRRILKLMKVELSRATGSDAVAGGAGLELSEDPGATSLDELSPSSFTPIRKVAASHHAQSANQELNVFFCI